MATPVFGEYLNKTPHFDQSKGNPTIDLEHCAVALLPNRVFCVFQVLMENLFKLVSLRCAGIFV